ncbi:MAG: hypothetical protein O3C40_24495, partial [Planctomycetota bacterium]|nr:hypothetical protein [Planctomycetota bacterium]
AGAIQMSLFDKQDLAEVTSEHFPQERLVVCRNPALAEQRARKRNEMQFSFLDEKDRAFVVGACKFFFQPAEEPPSKLPDGEMMLRFQLLFTVTFRKNGVAGQTGQGDFDLDWAEVKQVRLLYFDHWSDELCKIELELPIRTLRIEGVNKIKASGFDAPRVANPKVIPAVVADFLRRHVPEEKLVRHALHGPPATLAECEHRRRKLRRELRNVTWCYRLMPAGCLMLISLCLVPQLFARLGGPQLFPNAAWLALATLLLVATILSQPLMIWALLRDLRNRHAKALRELDAWELESLLRTPAESASSFRK